MKNCGSSPPPMSCSSLIVGLHVSDFWDPMSHARLCDSLVYCWSNWLGKFNSDIWNMVPGCLMWIVWMERNRRSFEDTEKSLVLSVRASRIVLLSWNLFDWSKCWGFSDCSTILEFISSLSCAL